MLLRLTQEWEAIETAAEEEATVEAAVAGVAGDNQS